MSTEAIRAEFERWFSEDGAWPAAIEKDRSGEYKLAAAVSSWHTWEAAMQHSARTALAQQAEVSGAPEYDRTDMIERWWRDEEPFVNAQPLYEAAPAAPAYVPLSDDSIFDLWAEHRSTRALPDYKQFARAVEDVVVARMRGEGK